MKLRTPPQVYSQKAETERNGQIERADAENHKRGRDVEVGDARLTLKSPDGKRWSITVSNAGAISATAI